MQRESFKEFIATCALFTPFAIMVIMGLLGG